ncbi:MAG: hypothetical protein ACHQ6T_02775 [Myxococcota bacterium]
MKSALRALTGMLVAVAIAGGALAVLVATNLRTYARLTYEQPVAEISFHERGPQRYLATVTRSDDHQVQTFELAGDEWQVDARVLKWHGLANLLGLDTRYRLERVSGRYRDIEQERSAPRSVFALGERPAIDLWSFAQTHPHWIPFVDGFYGSATYLPMAEGARYQVSLSQSGLLARPIDEARAQPAGWQ